MKRFINETVLFVKSNTPTNIRKPHTSEKLQFTLNQSFCGGTEWINLIIISNDKIVDGDYCINFDNMTIVKYCHSLIFKSINKIRKIIAISNIIYTDIPQIKQKDIFNIVETFNFTKRLDIVSIQYKEDIKKDTKKDDTKLIVVNKKNFVNLIVDECPKMISFDEKDLQMKFIYCLSEFAAERGLTNTANEMKIVNQWTRDWLKRNLNKET